MTGNNEAGMMTKLAADWHDESDYSYAKVSPISMSSSFVFDNIDDLDEVYGGKEGYIYSRIDNPSTNYVNKLIAGIEGYDEAVTFGSGMSAIITAILSFVQQGDHVIASTVLYGGVHDFLKNELPRFGIDITFINFVTDNVEDYIKPNTKIVYTETISNPLIEVIDLQAIADTAHKHGALFIVDNTFATPSVCKLINFDVDVLLYSATKFLGGHSDITCGIALANGDHAAAIRTKKNLYGGIISPFEAWLLTRSLRTLDLRVQRHCDNALKLAEYLEKHPKVKKVYYPGLASSPFRQLAEKQFEHNRFGGMLSVEFTGGYDGVDKFIRECKLIKFIPSLGGYSTSLTYPAKTSHRGHTPEELKTSGISTGLLRFSVGLENIGDIINEMENVLSQI
ncbi:MULTISPECIES: trans-sulfuration enzyme family protein [Gammaproteobacteria]|uniref:trans-sulfuration enzyme family protein n=1 Tax=Gammaproteobacteria TaxID=1236 RepID=UPI001BDA894D|nr:MULTISPECIES: aminotransferase class I/II-fold pyridoxal phosphate-dependent enzyme [Gammaproteobacteria]MCG6489951.1 aminotransferase class I/II-fold pyridoxal phosphate-dependent enzyme [Vibrio parahaemolyticus]